MNESTEVNINEAIDWLQQTGGAIQDFAVEQAPLYCREVVAWEFWNSTILGSTGLFMFIIGVVAFVKFIRFMKEDDLEPNARTLTAAAAMVFGLFIGLILATDHIPRAIKATVAPRLVIVEHLKNLGK